MAWRELKNVPDRFVCGGPLYDRGFVNEEKCVGVFYHIQNGKTIIYRSACIGAWTRNIEDTQEIVDQELPLSRALRKCRKCAKD